MHIIVTQTIYGSHFCQITDDISKHPKMWFPVPNENIINQKMNSVMSKTCDWFAVLLKDSTLWMPGLLHISSATQCGRKHDVSGPTLKRVDLN